MSNLYKTLFIVAVFMISYNNLQGKDNRLKFSQSALGKDLVASSNRFGLKLFKEIVDREPAADNVFISPLSVSYALSMTLNGADGKTRDAIVSTLEMAGISANDVNASYKTLSEALMQLDPSVIFEIANSIWYRAGLPVNRDFIELNRINFDALIQELDFRGPAAANTINAWVSENTYGKIQQIVSPPLDPSTIMFLINAIYFKGTWTAKFLEAQTKNEPFYLADGGEIPCRMMHNTDEFAYQENDLFQAVRLPYGNKAFAMIVFLPRPSLSVDTLVRQIDDQTWRQWIAAFLPMKVKLGLPRFKFQYDITMNDVLISMGMGPAFSPEQADFRRMIVPGIVAEPIIYIDQVKHKTFLQVDEEGTEAAAVTSATMDMTSAAPMKNPVMIIDRPFLFAIEEQNSKALLFVGRVMKPVWQE